MSIREISDLVRAVNSLHYIFKYPYGNKALVLQLRALESQKAIRFDDLSNKWVILK